MSKMNIIIRTSGRMNYFKGCIQSIKEQTFKNWRVIIGSESDYGYLRGFDYVRYDPVMRDPCNRIDEIRHFPYNLYLNRLMQEVKDGYVMFLDDDDMFTLRDSLDHIIGNIRDALFWRVKIGELIVPQRLDQRPKVKDVSGIGFAFHSKYIPLLQWDPYKQCDFRVASRLWDIAKHRGTVNMILTGTQKRNNEGSGIDKGNRFLFICPIYGRANITRIWASNIMRFPESGVLAIISPDDPERENNERICKDAGFMVCYYKNMPLGEKINAGINYALEKLDFEYMINIGSDDLIHPDILKLYDRALRDKYPFFGIDQVYFWDTKTRALGRSTENFWGAGRFIGRDLLKFVMNHGGLYDDRERGLDTYSMRKLEENTSARYRNHQTNNFPYVIDLKDKWNLNPFELMKGFMEMVDDRYLSRYYPKEIVNMVYGL